MDIFNFYKRTIFDDYNSLVKHLIENIDNYVKVVLFPPCYIVNKGNNQIDIEAIIRLRTMCKMRDDKGNLHDESINLVSLLQEISIYKYLNIYESITFNPSPFFNNPNQYNMYTGFKA